MGLTDFLKLRLLEFLKFLQDCPAMFDYILLYDDNVIRNEFLDHINNKAVSDSQSIQSLPDIICIQHTVRP